MNILIISSSNLKASGSIALDLKRGLKNRNHNVKILTLHEESTDKDICNMYSDFNWFLKGNFSKIIEKLNKYRRKIFKTREIPSDFDQKKEYFSAIEILKKITFFPDIIIIGFSFGLVNSKTIYELNKITEVPLFWWMWDMYPFTGGCHYAFECKRYTNKCGNCRYLEKPQPNDFSYKNLLYKKEYLDKTNLQIIAASEWQYLQAKKSTLFKDKPVHKIIISVNPDVFKPENKKNVRTKLGLPIDKKIVFFGAVSLSDERKGISFLLESLQNLKDQIKNTKLENNIFLIIAGDNVEKIKDILPFEYSFLGMLENPNGIATAFQAADIYVSSSIEDSGPTMINQSIMCGTPVVAFETGIVLDLVINDKTGYRAKIKDALDLSFGIFKILNLNYFEYYKMSNDCRELAIKLYAPEVQSKRFEELFFN